MSTTTQSSGSQPSTDNVVRDVFLWRKKKLSLSVVAVATVTWVALEIYQFNFITLASWIFMSLVTLTFLWGNLLRLLGKGEKDVSGFQVSEESIVRTSMRMKGCAEEGVRRMFHVGAEGDWFVFAEAVGALWVLSKVGSWFDFPTFLYLGVVVGMSVPVIYVKYEEQIKRSGERVKVQGRRWYEVMDEKVVRKIKQRVGLEGGDQQQQQQHVKNVETEMGKKMEEDNTSSINKERSTRMEEEKEKKEE